MAFDSGPEETAGPWVAVILSAGESARFGGQPKALLPVGSEAAIGRIARVCREAGATRVVGVLGAHRERIEQALQGTSVEIVENPDWANGRTGSVQAGLRAVEEAPQVLLWPVDHPFVSASTVSQLRAAAAGDELAVWLIPAFRGGSGHPVLLRWPAVPRVLELAPSAPLRSVLPGLGPQVRHVNVEDPGVLENVDSLDAYWSAFEAWKGRGGNSNGP